ncbi:MAG TPA: response regulator [Methanoregula sp.]|nr:response regulator [Methanoregula sp.]
MTQTVQNTERKKPVRVLVVDDESALAELAQIFLARENFFTDAADSADDAIAKISRYPFDAVVSDYQMPGKNGIEFLREVRASFPSLPFILFTGRGREEVVIQALNEGADFYLQKGGDPKSQFAELSHMILRAVERRNAAAAIEERNDVLGAVLAASPFGIALIKNRTIQWHNQSLASMLEYSSDSLIGMPVRSLYNSEEDYLQAGEQIVSELKVNGQSRIRAQLKKKTGSTMDCEIQMASLTTKNPLYSRMVTITDITKRLAITRELEHLSKMPHLELNPVIEVNQNREITYFNDLAIDLLIRHGSKEGLEAFLPDDLDAILAKIPKAGTQCIYRTIQIGNATLMENITLSASYRIARISAFDIKEAKQMDMLVGGENARRVIEPGL